MPIEPDSDQIRELSAVAGGPDDGPVVMLNLNRYRERAAYESAPPGGEDPDVGGREAYARYGIVAMATLARLGAKILWHADAGQTVVGDETDVYDEVVAVWYPSRAAFLELATDAVTVAAMAHRVAGLERAAIIACPSGPEAELTGF
jgi:hypothetical protein